jgi:hypothetical protein
MNDTGRMKEREERVRGECENKQGNTIQLSKRWAEEMKLQKYFAQEQES